MMFRKFVPLSFIFLSFSAFAQTHPIPVIFDTDMGPDYDDVGAITLLHTFADNGKVKILATVASTHYDNVAAVLNVFNTYFHRPHIPIGVAKKGLTLRDWQHWTDSVVANYPHSIHSNNEVPDAVEVYRKVLARQPDKTVTIITVGFLTNLAGLLKSSPDQYSPLSGEELVKKKVKLLVSMAGKYPEGKEFNIEKDAPAAQFVFSQWPTRVVFSGFEIGQKIKVGTKLVANEKIRNSPVKDVFRICLPLAKEDNNGRMSWDETAVLAAVKGTSSFYSLHRGKIKIADDGSNTWLDGEGNQAHLVESAPPQQVQELIELLIQHQPANRRLHSR